MTTELSVEERLARLEDLLAEDRQTKDECNALANNILCYAESLAILETEGRRRLHDLRGDLIYESVPPERRAGVTKTLVLSIIADAKELRDLKLSLGESLLEKMK
jgi:hypothetical protein